MDGISQSDQLVEFCDRVSPLARILIFVFGLIPLYAPYDLLFPLSRWNGFSFFLVWAVVISLGAMGLSVLFTAVAFLGINSTVRFDGVRRILTYGWETAVTRLKVTQHGFDEIERFRIETHEWTDGPATHNIVVELKAGGKFEFGKFDVRTDAERYLEKLNKMI